MGARDRAGQKRTDIDTRCTSENKRELRLPGSGQFHPLITPMGRSRATFRASPAEWTTSITSSTFL